MGLMKQAKEMQAKMETAQTKVAELEVEGRSGGGMVKVSLTGEGNMKGLTIDPSLLDGEDVEILEDLIVAAYQDAKAKTDEAKAEMMKSAFGDLPMPPGMKMPF